METERKPPRHSSTLLSARPRFSAAEDADGLSPGDLALRAGGKIEWDAATMEAKNNPAATPFIRPAFRQGWSL